MTFCPLVYVFLLVLVYITVTFVTQIKWNKYILSYFWIGLCTGYDYSVGIETNYFSGLTLSVFISGWCVLIKCSVLLCIYIFRDVKLSLYCGADFAKSFDLRHHFILVSSWRLCLTILLRKIDFISVLLYENV